MRIVGEPIEIIEVEDLDSGEVLWFHTTGHDVDPATFIQKVAELCDELGLVDVGRVGRVENVRRRYMRVIPNTSLYDEESYLEDTPGDWMVPVTVIDAGALADGCRCEHCGRWVGNKRFGCAPNVRRRVIRDGRPDC